MKQGRLIILAAFTLGLLNWVLDSYIDYVYYHEGASFLDLLALDIPEHEIYYRAIIFFTITLSGVIISRLFESRDRYQKELERANESLEAKVQDRTKDLKAAKESAERELQARILAEEKARAREEYFRCLIENSSDIINAVDEKGVIRYCSPTVKRLLGREPHELVGKTVVSLVHPDDAAKAEHTLREALKTIGGTVSVESRILGQEGQWRVFESFGQAHVDPESGKRFVVVSSRDITARKAMELHLAESEAKFERLSREFSTLLDAMPEKIALLSKDLGVVWANKGAAEGRVAPGEDVRGLSCHELWHDRAEPCGDCPVIRALRTGNHEGGRIRSSAGRVWEVRAIPVSGLDGDAGRVLTIGSDITDKLAMEEEALVNARLASVGQLAAGVAHEINNPINGIINYAQILLNKSTAGTREHDTLKGIVKEGGRIAAIVRGLLSFSRQTDNEKGPLSVRKVLDETMTLVRSQITREGVSLDLAVEPGLPPVQGNLQQMQQVFINVIGNSLYALRKKFAVPCGDKALTIAAKRCVARGVPSVRVTFHDRGTGIPAGLLSKVMLPFVTTKPPGEGTGLGLSVSHGIVRDHGGEMTIESAEGEFTKVIITLPAAGEG